MLKSETYKKATKILNGFWLLCGIIIGCILHFLITLIPFPQKDILFITRTLCIVCFLLITIWPITIVILLMSGKYKDKNEK